MSKYAVTGGCGFIGSHLVHRLIKEGHEVVVIDDLSTGNYFYLPKSDKLTFLNIDISSWGRIWSRRSKLKGIDGIFHLAAFARIQPSMKTPVRTHEINVKGTLNILELMRKNNIKNIVYSASSSSYGLKAKLPCTEDQPYDCLNPYAYSKAAGEMLCKSWGVSYGIQNVCLKYFNVYGPRSPELGSYAPVIGLFFRQALKDYVNLTVVGDGEQKRDFTYVDDVVEANLQAMKKMEEGVPVSGMTFNVGCGKNYTINQVAAMVLDSLHKDGLSPNIKIIHTEARPGEARETLADISLAKEYLEWIPQVSLEEGIERIKPFYVEKFRKKSEHRKGYK